MKVIILLLVFSNGAVFGKIVRVKNSNDVHSNKTEHSCPEELEWFNCSFNVTCEEFTTHSEEFGVRKCSPGCYCPQQYYAYKDQCYKFKDCPNIKSSRKKCSSPLKWDDCYFNISCSEYPISSSEYEKKSCKPGCFCPKDYYVYKNKCFFYNECPDECFKGREWKDCGNYCRELCPVLQPRGGCHYSTCASGCFCKHGRYSFAGHCLDITDCPTNITKTVLTEIKSDFAYMEL